jgi:hypothetical protein
MRIAIAAPDKKALSVQLSSAFLLEDALRIDDAIAGAAPGASVDIDFHLVRECHGAALARLAEAMRSGRARVAVRGMSGHHRKLLGYLGIPEVARQGESS